MARLPTRHRHWRRVGSRAAAQKLGSRVDLAQFHLLFPSLPAVRVFITCKRVKHPNQLILIFV
jgi:hypothetical protein